MNFEMTPTSIFSSYLLNIHFSVNLNFFKLEIHMQAHESLIAISRYTCISKIIDRHTAPLRHKKSVNFQSYKQ